MDVSILIATYGEDAWRDLAWSRAYPSAQAQDPAEVLVLHEPESTISQVRNTLGKDASSEWLCFLDADDELGPGYLSAMAAAHNMIEERNPRSEVLYTPAVSYVHPSGKSRPPRFLRSRATLKDDNYLVVGTLVRRDLFLHVAGFGDYPHGFEDWSLWAKCWKAGAEIVEVSDAVYMAHMNPDSKHRLAWKNREWQVGMHHRVRRDIFPELYQDGRQGGRVIQAKTRRI